jgi:hypothetical protein
MSESPMDFEFVHTFDTGDLTIRRGNAVALQVVYTDELAEINLFDELDLSGDPDVELPIYDVNWIGTGSGKHLDVLLRHILPETKGRAEVVMVVEGGEYFFGFEISNGVMTEKQVKLELV